MPWDWLCYEHEWLCSECCEGITNNVWQFWGCLGLNPDIQGRRVRPRVVYVDVIGNLLASPVRLVPRVGARKVRQALRDLGAGWLLVA